MSDEFRAGGPIASDVLARLDAIERTLARIEASMPRGEARAVYSTTLAPDVVRPTHVSWTEQQDPTSWAPGRVARLTPDATPGVVDPDDRAALQRMASKCEHRNTGWRTRQLPQTSDALTFVSECSTCGVELDRLTYAGADSYGKTVANAAVDFGLRRHGIDCASGREPMGEGEGEARIPATDQHADYWRDMAALDTPRESKRHARKWWLLWLA